MKQNTKKASDPQTRGEFYLRGAKDSLPIVMGYIPVGIAFAVLSLSTGFDALQTFLMSLTVYSGAGQFLGVALAGSGAGLVAVAIGIAIINFRYFIMSLCVFARFKELSLLKRVGFSHLVTDETFAIFTTNDKKFVNMPYFLGLFTTSYIAWNTGTVLGILASKILPQTVTLSLGIALYALFIAIIVPGARASWRMALVIIGVAVSNSVLTMILTSEFGRSSANWSLVVTMVAGALIGALFIKAPDEDTLFSKSDEEKGAGGEVFKAGSGRTDKAPDSDMKLTGDGQ